MQELLSLLTDFRAFVLIAFRIGGMVLMAPFFSSTIIPMRLRVGLAFALAAVVFPTVKRSDLVVPDNIVGYVAATLAETAIGAIIGLAASLIFAAIELGGFIAAEQVGLAISHVFDPLSNEESSLIGQVYFFFGVTIFALVGGQHMLLRAVSASFNIVPLASLPGGSGWAGVVGIDMAGQMFVTAVRISAPAVVALMMTTIVMAIVARAVPEMNIFNIGFAVRLGVGLGVLALTVPALGVAFQKLFSNLGSNLNILLDAMRST